MAATEDEARGFEIGHAFVRVSPDTSAFAAELQAQVGSALTGPQADQAQADGIYIEKTVISTDEIRQIRYGLPPRPPLPPTGLVPFADFPEDRGPVITLPSEMAGRMPEQIRTIDGEWREVFPGLQAQVTQVEMADDRISFVQPKMRAMVRFRLTPPQPSENTGG